MASHPTRGEGFRKKISRAVGRHAREIAKEIEATTLVACVDASFNEEEVQTLIQEGRCILAVMGEGTVERLRDLGVEQERILALPSIKPTRTSQVKVAVLLAFSRGLVQRNDLVVCLSGSPHLGLNDSLTIMDVGNELEIFSSSELDITSELEHPYVFDRLLTLALELAQEGKEGKPLGTTFVLGDHEKVLESSGQIVINPFAGVPESERNILDPPLKEVIREFASIDGAFVIREDGVVLAAGRHLNVSAETGDLPQGLGARHRSAAGITALTEAIAVVLSESTGDVRIFGKGHLFMEIERSGGWR